MEDVREKRSGEVPLPLAGVKVVEVCSLVAGPYCGRLLGGLGATVVKIEHPSQGDMVRSRGPFYHDDPGPDTSLLHSYVNLDKYGVTLDFSNPSGRQILLKLASRADVLILDLSPGELKAYDLEIETFFQRNPSLIVASITPFGFSGPHADYKATYLNTYHSGGDAYVLPGGQVQDQMFPERGPIKGAGYVGECQAGASLAVAVLGALIGRNRGDRKGHHIDLSKQEAVNHVERSRHQQVSQRGNGAESLQPAAPFYVGGLFQCQDGFWEFVINSDRSWEAIVEFMGHPEWTDDPRFGTHHSRVIYRREIEDLIEEWAIDHTRDEIFHGLQQRGCPAAPVLLPTEVVRDEQLRERGFWTEVSVPFVGELPVPTVAPLLPGAGDGQHAPAPGLGQHNVEIYTGWLDVPKEDLAALRAAGVI